MKFSSSSSIAALLGLKGSLSAKWCVCSSEFPAANTAEIQFPSDITLENTLETLAPEKVVIFSPIIHTLLFLLNLTSQTLLIKTDR